jgi:hypothetical protein
VTLEEIKELGSQADVFKFDPDARYLVLLDRAVWRAADAEVLSDALNVLGVRHSTMLCEGELGLKVFELNADAPSASDTRTILDAWTCDNHAEPITYYMGQTKCEVCGRDKV